MCIFYDRIILHFFDINIHSSDKENIGFARLSRWVSEAAFFSPKLCSALRVGENTANLRRPNKKKWRSKAPFRPVDHLADTSAANGLAPISAASP